MEIVINENDLFVKIGRQEVELGFLRDAVQQNEQHMLALQKFIEEKELKDEFIKFAEEQNNAKVPAQSMNGSG